MLLLVDALGAEVGKVLVAILTIVFPVAGGPFVFFGLVVDVLVTGGEFLVATLEFLVQAISGLLVLLKLLLVVEIDAAIVTLELLLTFVDQLMATPVIPLDKGLQAVHAPVMFLPSMRALVLQQTLGAGETLATNVADASWVQMGGLHVISHLLRVLETLPTNNAGKR